MHCLQLQSRAYKIWITKNAPQEWKFANTDAGGAHLKEYITGAQLKEAIYELASFRKEEATPPFMILDVRAPHEREIKDIVSEVPTDDGTMVKIPRVNLIYEELVTGVWNNDSFARSTWIVCLCSKGLRSG